MDAHADFNTPETSLSGNVDGMPLAVLCGLGHPDLVGVGGGGASVHPEDVVLVGLRRVDPEERRLLAEAGVQAYTMKDVDAHGIAKVVDRVLDDLSHLRRVHLSFDLDVVDPGIAPGVGTPVRGGLTYREAHLLMELLGEAAAITSRRRRGQSHTRREEQDRRAGRRAGGQPFGAEDPGLGRVGEHLRVHTIGSPQTASGHL